MSTPRVHRARRSFATAIVLWVLAIATLVVVDLQSASFAEAASGRESLGRLRARWAARGAIESAIARLAQSTIQPDPGDAFDAEYLMEEVATGELDGADSIVRVSTGGDDLPGPRDAGARININTMSADALLTLPFMTQDVADAILDWIDEDDDTRPFGAEIGSYATMPYPYEPRNAPFQSLLEVELVLGVLPEIVRGEDWNLNGVLDPNENDADDSWPPDNADGVLDAGWSAIITTQSVRSALGFSGEPRLILQLASANDVAGVLNTDNDQSEAIVNLAVIASPTPGDFIRTDLNTLAQQNGLETTSGDPLRPLSDEQLAVLLAETYVADESGEPGKINLNTIADSTLEYLPEIPVTVRDAIVFDRKSRSQGYTSLMDLLDIPGLTRERVADLADLADVRSSVYIITARGRDLRTGIEYEMSATIDRSSLPIIIREIVTR